MTRKLTRFLLVEIYLFTQKLLNVVRRVTFYFTINLLKIESEESRGYLDEKESIFWSYL